MGRPQKPYQTTYGSIIPGLAKESDGRWRIVSTGKRFSESDERRAIQKFRELVGDQPHKRAFLGKLDANLDGMEPTLIRQPKFLAAIRNAIIEQPKEMAKLLGIEEIGYLTKLKPPVTVKLATIRELYRTLADVSERTRAYTLATFDEFVKIMGATTLDDLEPKRLAAYRDAIKKRVESPATQGQYFSRIKTVIRFAKKHSDNDGIDVKAIEDADATLAILSADKDDRTHQPSPLSRENFAKLLAVVRQRYPHWEARLVMMLNLCLHFGELMDLRWVDINLDAGTFCNKRAKRGRIIRAAKLWGRTIELMRKIERKGPFVFTSQHGTKFSSTGQWKTWDEIRRAAGCADVQLDDFRDGAYTTACNKSDARLAKVFAGHSGSGFEDRYVERNPGLVAPVCEAVEREYFPQ